MGENEGVKVLNTWGPYGGQVKMTAVEAIDLQDKRIALLQRQQRIKARGIDV